MNIKTFAARIGGITGELDALWAIIEPGHFDEWSADELTGNLGYTNRCFSALEFAAKAFYDVTTRDNAIAVRDCIRVCRETVADTEHLLRYATPMDPLLVNQAVHIHRHLCQLSEDVAEFIEERYVLPCA